MHKNNIEQLKGARESFLIIIVNVSNKDQAFTQIK